MRRLLGGLCAAGLGWMLAGVVPFGTASMSASASRVFHARALRAFKAELARTVGPMLRDHRIPQRSVNGVTVADSYNWSGFADTSSTTGEFSAVSGSWTVPTVTCTSEDRVAAVWVGLDGATTSTVEQDGTSAQCFEGKAVYYSWYEMYPAGSVTVGTTVKAGDKITSSVSRTGTTYTLKVTDSTTSGNNISVTKTCAATTCTDKSAEWIGERPALTTTGIVPFAQFNTPISFTGASETAGGKSGTISTGPSPEQIFMIDSTGTYDLATPSSLNSSGNAFTDKWDNSY